MRVLVVEDDVLLSRSIAGAVAALGHEAVAVPSADAARREILYGRFDVLLTDETLGEGESGSSLLAWALDHFPSLRRVLMSGRAPSEVMAATSDAVLFLSKPFTWVQFSRMLEQLEVERR